MSKVENFRIWLRDRKNPDFYLIKKLRKLFQEGCIERPSLYDVQFIVENTEDFKLQNIFHLTLAIHNEEFQTFTEDQIDQLCKYYELWLKSSELETFQLPNKHELLWPEDNAIYTYESILIIISSLCNIDAKIRKQKCPVCSDKLGWFEDVQKCGHVYHSVCCRTLEKCCVCNEKLKNNKIPSNIPLPDLTLLYPSVLLICDHGNHKQNCMICKYYDQPTEKQETALPHI
jgi:hypothetical protein